MRLPPSLQSVIDEFARLPAIGRKSAERLAFHLLRRPEADLERFAQAILKLKSGITYCAVCGTLTEQERCEVCRDERRDRSLVCVVADPRNMVQIEATGAYNGTYHILGGLIDTAHGITPDHLNVKRLIERINSGVVKEVVIALNPTFEGETTALYLTNILKNYSIKITRLARGLPSGAEIEYADELTLGEALKHRF